MFLAFLLLKETSCQKIVLNAVALSLNENNHIYSSLISEFNKYSDINNLGVKVKLNVFTLRNSTSIADNFETMIETLLIRKSTKYDLYFYDQIYSNKLGQFFIDLNKYLDVNHIKMFDQNIIEQTCYYKDRLVGIVIIFCKNN
ncbi:hypothetical protein PIROE2DRAFT_3341 [Piromyces sp. E2]|nr:hypothetical protein PIROE2DRAFT_3341 [Piromyces sp. E2]|eukprot:OUM68823.1 hypothetical protein PIROE2DRAFT_3341 [Piromyces sp. E2]